MDACARILWDYHHLGHTLAPSDAILVLGSHDTRVAEWGATLYLQGWAPLLVLSGGQGLLTRDWPEPEAERFAEIARGMGVPDEAILIENRSTNTGENILFTRQLLVACALDPQRVLLVQKPYMERRAYATIRQRWPEVEVIVTSPPIPFDDYPNAEISRERVIELMVGDLQRCKLYPALGYQIAQEIPPMVWQAYERLIEAGYTAHLVKETPS